MRYSGAGLCLLAIGARVPAAHAGTVCTVLADAGTGAVLRQEGRCDRRFSPASTFKIPISLMGYDAGILTDEHTPSLPFREGYADWIPAWRTDTDPTAWMKNSVVWYSQQITQRLGAERFRTYVTAFDYGNRDVSGDPGKGNGLTRAWLSSSLEISPLEQVAFLGRLATRQLGVSARAYEMTAQLTAFGTVGQGWELHGKTGTGVPPGPDGKSDWTRAHGWFVGWATKEGRTVAFARLVQDERREAVSPGFRARDALLQELPALLEGSTAPRR